MAGPHEGLTDGLAWRNPEKCPLSPACPGEFQKIGRPIHAASSGETIPSLSRRSSEFDELIEQRPLLLAQLGITRIIPFEIAGVLLDALLPLPLQPDIVVIAERRIVLQAARRVRRLHRRVRSLYRLGEIFLYVVAAQFLRHLELLIHSLLFLLHLIQSHFQLHHPGVRRRWRVPRISVGSRLRQRRACKTWAE